jgi:uncharacterized protein (DUF736 family)
MSSIGTFTKIGDGYNGTLETLTFNIKVKIVVVPRRAQALRTITSPQARWKSALAGSVKIQRTSHTFP